MRSFVGGFAAALVLLALVVFGAVVTGAVPARADGPLLPGEKWMAGTSLRATVAREAPSAPYPFGQADADIATGAKLYVQNCAVCHGSANSTPTAIARGLAVRSPQFAKNDVMDDPEGVTYWKIEHGIKMTGMPAFAPTLDEKSIWQITYFLKRAPDHLTGAAKSIWDNPAQVPPAPALPAPPQPPGKGGART